jgi:hypothetical protein
MIIGRKKERERNEKKNDDRDIVSKTFLRSSAFEREYTRVKERKKEKKRLA